jgi:pyridoxine 5'-phosphate synthase PdxJ
MPSTSNHSRSRSPTPPPSPVPSPTPALEKQTKALRRQTQVAPRDDYTSGGSTKSLSELLKEMQECQNDPDALRTTLHRMRNSQGEYPPGAVKQIEPLLGQWCLQPRLLALVSGTIWRICASGDDGKQETADAGAIGELVDILRKNPNDRDLAEWIIGTLASLAYYDSTKKVIARVGGIEAILDSLKRHDKWLGNLELSCRCLYNMVVQYGDQIEKEKGGDEDTQRTIALIEEADGVAVIVKALEKNPTAPTAQRWALKLLWRLVSRSEDSTSSRVLRKMAEAGFALVANKVIRGSLTTGELFQVTVELTCLVLGNLEDDQENLESAIDCIPSATRRMRESVDDEAIQESGCRLLAILCSDDGRVVSALKDAEAFATVIRSLESHSKNTFVAEAACWALWKLSAQASLLNAPLVRRARKAMQDVVELNDEDQRIIVSVCGFTANACYVPTLKASDFPIACIVRAAELPSEDPTSYEVAESAISNLYDVFPDETSSNLAEVIKIPRMIEIIEDSSSTIRASICMWLARIATKSNKASDILSAGILEASVAVFTASRDLQLLEDSKDFPVLSNLLDLISTLLVTGDTRQVRLPSDIAQSISTMLNTDQLRADSFLVKSCSTLRNILLVSVSPLEVNGLVDCMTNAIHSSKSSTELRIEVCCVLWAMTTKNSSQNGMTLSTMLNAVVTLMEDRGDGTPYQPRLQTAAAGAAASISWCLRQDPSIIDSESVDALIANVYRALEFDHDGVETMTSILSALLNLIYLDEGTVLRSGAIVVVIDLMFEVENHAAIQEKGCTILARLAASEDLQVNLSIVQTEGIDLLVMTLATYSTNEVIQTQACKALSHLSIDPESRMLITSQGGLELIVNALNVYRGNLEVAESATLALLNLSADGEGELLISSGVVEAVVQAMKKYRNNSKLQENGMGVLQNVSMKAARAKEVIAESEGIDAIVSAVREFLAEPAVLERAFTALWSLAVLDSNQVRIANANGIAMVINGMLSSIDNDSVQKQGCGCLCTLASNVSNKVLIRSTGGVDAIMYGMWAHYSSESLQTEACRALSSLAVDMVASENEIKAILTAMRSFPDSEDLQEHACFAIRNYLLSPDNSLIRSKAAEVRTAVYGALTTCPDSCSTLADEVLAMLD